MELCVQYVAKDVINESLQWSQTGRWPKISKHFHMAPNRIIAHYYGPLEGRQHHAGLLWESWVENDMHQNMTSPNNEAYCVNGDPA